VLRVKRALEAGLFGRIVLGNAVVHWRRTQEYYDAGGWRGTWKFDGGGALMNQSIHSIDLLQWMLGPVASLAGYTGTLAHNIETEDTATAALHFTSGAMGGIQGTTSMHRDWPPRVEIRGTEGSATLEGMRLTSWEPMRDAELLSAEDLESTHELRDGDPGWIMHRTQMRNVFTAIGEGRAAEVSGEEARKALEIILAIYRSARTGERVKFPFS
jgi:predicted dehydrogenase